MKRAASIFLLCLFSCALARAEDAGDAGTPPVVNPAKQDYHLCRNEDLIGGTWKLVLFREAPPRREASYYRSIPYHYLGFFNEHAYGYIASNREMPDPTTLQKDMLDSITAVQRFPKLKNRLSPYYTLDDKGVLILYRGKRTLFSFRCTAVDNTQGDFVKGDLILNGYTKKKKSQLYELYRRWY